MHKIIDKTVMTVITKVQAKTYFIGIILIPHHNKVKTLTSYKSISIYTKSHNHVQGVAQK